MKRILPRHDRALALFGALTALAVAAALAVRSDDSDAPATPARDSSGKRRREALDPKQLLPPGSAPSQDDVLTVRRALSKIYHQRNQVQYECGNIFFGAGRFFLEEAFHSREHRLLAEAYPAAAEVVAVDLLRKPDSTQRETAAALPMLGFLAQRGNRRAELELLKIASDSSDPRESDALDQLIQADPEFLYDRLYRERCALGSYSTFDVFDVRSDPLSVSLLEKGIADAGPYAYEEEELSMLPDRLRILRSRNSEELLKSLLLENPVKGSSLENERGEKNRRWVLRAARYRKLNLQATLRKRLDQDLLRYQQQYSTWPQAPAIGISFATERHLFPRDWDEVLMAYVDAGGVPNELESKRLRHFGYRCNPKERLEEILAALK